MAKEIGENQIHELTVTCPYDLSGQTLELQYVPKDGGAPISVGSTTGASEGTDVVITADIAANGISSGFYDLEIKYTDGAFTRQLNIDNSSEDTIHILDAKSVS